MVSALLLTGIFLAISVLLGYLASKKIFKLANTIFTVVMLALTLVSVWMYFDAEAVREKMMEEKIFILEHEDGIEAAFIHKDTPTPTVLKDISAERAAFAAGDRDGVIGDRVLLFKANHDTFRDLQEVHVDNYTFTKDWVFFQLTNDNARQEYADEVKVFLGLPVGQEVQPPNVTDEEFRGMLFAALINDYLSENTVIDALNAGDLEVYPLSITFWVIKKLPKSMLNYIIDTEDVSGT